GGPVRLSLSVLTPRARVELLLAPEGRILRQTAEALPEPPTPPPPPPPPPDPRPAPAPPPPPALAAPTVGPMALAARALVEEVGTGRALWEVAVWGDRVTVSANATGGGRALRELRFDGSRFVPTPHGLVNTASLMGNIAFSAAEVDLAALPRVIAAAATAAGPQAGPFRRAEAKASTAAGRPMVVWRLTFGAPNAPAADLTEVVLTPDALVQRVILPEAQRPPFEGHAGPGFTRALAEILSTFPPDTRIFEIDARPDRVSIERPHPTEGGKTARSTLSPRGLRADPDFPLMMQTEADIFDLSAVAGLTAETLDRIRADAVAAVGIPGGQAVRFRIWSGAPFWRHPAGQPFLDIRIEGDNGRNGYAVFTLDGQGVAAFR
ncbi:MAG TPA: hypothetical protein PKC84_12555, partial [Paracoccaceae bacterium]|nr:hypothetical protein [Paracoccaceae bacterium]